MKSALTLRREPSQERSRKTFERILESAIELLEEQGWDGFNTNALAAHAGLGIQALYRYFPNKRAVMTVLAERMAREWDGWFVDIDDALEQGRSWTEIWSSSIDTFIDGLRSMPGGLAIRQAMTASAALREIDQRDNERLAERLGEVLLRQKPGLRPKEAHAAARTLIESATAVLDVALLSEPAAAKRLVSEVKRMQLAYLSECFGLR